MNVDDCAAASPGTASSATSDNSPTS